MSALEGGPLRQARPALRPLLVLLLLAAGPPAPLAQMDFTAVRRDMAVGSTPRTIAAGDLNGDGKQDLVVVAGSSNAVSILLNAGGGVFRPVTKVVTGDSPNAAVLANFNSDAFPDMVVATYLSNQIQIYLGNGSGGFAAPTSISTGSGSGPWALAVLDWNQDGKNDLVVILYGTSRYRLYIGNGAGGFSLHSEYSVALHPVAVTAGDLDGDDIPDVAIVSEGSTPPNGTVTVAYGCPLGFCFPVTTTVYSTPASITSGLLDTDIYPDLVVGSMGSNNLAILYQDIAGFTSVTPLNVGGGSFTAAVGDFNGDTKQDIAVGVQRPAGQGAVKIYTGNGLRIFSEGGTFPTGSVAADMVAVDFGGSTALDLATANTTAASVSLLIGDGAGGFTTTPRYAFPASSNIAGLASADMNGDGKIDLAVTWSDGTGVELDSLALLQGSGTGTFSAWQSLTLRGSTAGDAQAGPVLFAPFVGADSNPDLAVLLGGIDKSFPPAVELFPGNGSGVFGARQDYLLGYDCIKIGPGEYDCLDPQAMAAAPLNDTDTLHPDLAVTVLGGDATFPNGFLSVLLQSGGAFSPATRYAPWGAYCLGGVTPGAACTLDSNCPGRCSGSTTLCSSSLDCPSPQTCSNPPPGTCEPMGPTGIAAGLVNGDGNRDLMVCGSTGNKAAFLPGNGTGTFSTLGSLTGTGTNPQWPILKDLDGDLDQDMVVLNYMGGTVSIFQGDNAGNFAPLVQVPGLRFPYRGVMADLNLDGWDDLAVGNLSMGTVSVLPGDGSGHFGAPIHLGVGNTPRYITTADYNGDGKPDLTTSDGGDGAVSILLNTSRDPVLTLTQAGSTTTAAWPGMFEASSYDVIRGLISQLTQTDTQVNLGDVTCVENDSPDTLSTESGNPALETIYFYVMRTQDPYVKGSYGLSSLNKIRVPASGDCL